MNDCDIKMVFLREMVFLKEKKLICIGLKNYVLIVPQQSTEFPMKKPKFEPQW